MVSEAEKKAAKVNEQRNLRVAATSEQGRRFLQNEAANADLNRLRELSQAGVPRDILARGIQQGISQRQQGISQRQAIRQADSQKALIAAQGNSFETQILAKQAAIKIQQTARKNEKLIREIEATKKAKETLLNNPNPIFQARKLVNNYDQKISELQDEVKRNNRSQLNLLGGFQAKSRDIISEQSQRRQTQTGIVKSAPTIKKGSTALGLGGAFSFTPSSLRTSNSGQVIGPQRQNIFPSIESSFGSAPKKLPSESSRPVQSDQERFLGGLFAPIKNLKTQSEDFFGDLVSGNLKREPLGTPGNIFGLPVAQTKRPLEKTASSEIFAGRAPNLKDPAIAGSAITEAAFILAPVAATKVAPRISTGITTARQKGVVTNLAKSRKSEGVFNVEKVSDNVFAINRGTEGRGLVSNRPVKSRLEIFNVGRNKAADFTKTPKKVTVPKEGRQSENPLTIVKFGKRSQFGKDPEVIDFKPSRQVNNPRRTVATGDIEDFVGKSFGLTRKSKNTFSGKQTPEQRASLRDAEQFGKVQTFAEGNSAPLSKVRSGDLFGFMGQGAIKTKVVASKANQFGQRKGTVGGRAGKGIDVGSKSFDRELTGLGLGGKRVSSRFDRQKTPFDSTADDIIGGGSSKTITSQQKTFIKQSFGKTKSVTKQRQDAFGTVPFNQQQSQRSQFDTIYGEFLTPQPKSKHRTISPPKTGALFNFGSVTPQRQKDTTIGIFQPVRETSGLTAIPKRTERQRPQLDIIPIFNTGTRRRSGSGTRTIPREDIILNPPTTTTPPLLPPVPPPPKQPPIKPPRFGFGLGIFDGFGFDRSRRSRRRGKTAFEVNTAFNPVDPFGGKVEGFGGIIRTRTDRELEAVDDLFVGEAKRQSKKNKGFTFAGFDILDSDNSSSKKKKSKNFFDLF